MARILIVDDEPDLVSLIDDILTPLGHDTIRAFNGKEALEKLEKTVPDLVLLDIMMPEMDGLEVCRRIKEDPEKSGITVVMVTGKRDMESHIDAVLIEADGYIVKPFSVKAFIKEVTGFLEGKGFGGSISDVLERVRKEEKE